MRDWPQVGLGHTAFSQSAAMNPGKQWSAPHRRWGQLLAAAALLLFGLKSAAFCACCLLPLPACCSCVANPGGVAVLGRRLWGLWHTQPPGVHVLGRGPSRVLHLHRPVHMLVRVVTLTRTPRTQQQHQHSQQEQQQQAVHALLRRRPPVHFEQHHTHTLPPTVLLLP